MKDSLKKTKSAKLLSGFFLIFAYSYLIICPFTHALIPDNDSQKLIPQKEAIDNHYKQKVLISSPLYHSEESPLGMWLYKKTAINLPIITQQELAFSLFIIATIKLIV